MRWLILTAGLVACGIPEDRYLVLRQQEDCRIFGPDCTGDYDSFEACIGDEPSEWSGHAGAAYEPRNARECIDALRGICPVRGVDYGVPSVCEEVYSES